ncbi:MAG: M23 family metallopeptidase [Deltaproteobacteria bacterium]|nr:M23 family metallopeptidase [Deltaproteobacteria bacterium]
MPEGRPDSHRFNLSRKTLKLLVFFTAAWLIVTSVITGFALYYRSGWLSTSNIREQNEKMLAERTHVEERLVSLEQVIARAGRLASSLESAVGINSKVMRKGIGPISEEEDLPDANKLKLTSKYELGATDDYSSSTGFDDLELKMDDLNETVASVEMRLQEVYEFHQGKLAYWASIPSIWPVRGWVTSEFGMRRSPRGIGTRFHEGIDIAASIGTPVYASGDGVVTFAGYKNGLGKTIIIDHGFGITTVYGHNSSLYVREGERVKRGSSISAVGRTGRTTGPHLHYQVVVDGMPVDPMRYIIESF